MYRRPKFLEVLLNVREEMAREADYDVDRFAERVRSSARKKGVAHHSLTDDENETVARSGRKPRKARS